MRHDYSMIISTFLYLLFFIGFSDELNNGLGRTPQMGKIDNLYGNARFFSTSVNMNERYIFFLLKDGIVGIISIVVSMKP